MRPKDAARVTSTEQLPAPLRAPVTSLLGEYARTLHAEGRDSAAVAGDVAFLLQRIALAEECPTLAEAQYLFWPPMMNHERRAFLKLCSPQPAPVKHHLDPNVHRTNQTLEGRLALGGRHAEEEPTDVGAEDLEE